MAYQDSPVREMTPQEQLTKAAANLAGAGDELSTASAILYEARATMHDAEDRQMRAQSGFDERIREFRQVVDQYGLTMSTPEPEPRGYR